MASITLNDNLKKFLINGDPKRAIFFDPGDFSIVTRLKELTGKYKEQAEKIEKGLASEIEDENERGLALMERMDKFVRETIDDIFGAPVADVAFGKKHAMALCGGVPLFVRFIVACLPIIEKECEAAKNLSQAQVEKYIVEQKKAPKKAKK